MLQQSDDFVAMASTDTGRSTVDGRKVMFAEAPEAKMLQKIKNLESLRATDQKTIRELAIEVKRLSALVPVETGHDEIGTRKEESNVELNAEVSKPGSSVMTVSTSIEKNEKIAKDSPEMIEAASVAKRTTSYYYIWFSAVVAGMLAVLVVIGAVS
jgi:hypothetical protein